MHSVSPNMSTTSCLIQISLSVYKPGTYCKCSRSQSFFSLSQYCYSCFAKA